METESTLNRLVCLLTSHNWDFYNTGTPETYRHECSRCGKLDPPEHLPPEKNIKIIVKDE